MHKLNKDFISKTADSRIYGCPVPIIALTGGIATGKSTVVNLLKKKGIPILDADHLVKEIYKRPKTIEFILKLKLDIVSDSGEINFPMLRKIFFENENIKNKIEAYIYNELPATFLDGYSKLNLSKFNFVVYDIPLLFEKHLQSKFDLNVLVYAPVETQRMRLINRDNIDKLLANKILQQQTEIDLKRDLADFIIENTSNISDLSDKVDVFLNKISTQEK